MRACAASTLTVILLALAWPAMAQPSSAKYRVIIDSDAKNEIDDQYAITYALKHPDLQVLAINATQFAQPGSMQQSYEEIKKILELMNLTNKVRVCQGAEQALIDRQTPQPSEAAQCIIAEAMASPEKLYIVAHGALTNVASAYLLNPDIAARVELYWLGGSFWPEGGREFNAENDPYALQVVMDSLLSVHLIPAHGVGGLLGLSYYEASRRLRHTERIGDFLAERFAQIGDASRAIWDLSAPALLLHPEWGKQIQVPAPVVTDDLRYLSKPERKNITVFTDLDADKIFEDFFSRFVRPLKSDALQVIGASCTGDSRRVRVEFSNYLDKESAEDKRNYTIAGVQVLEARLSRDDTKVLLTTTPHEPGKTYELKIQDVADHAQNPSRVPAGSSVSYTYFPSFNNGLECAFFQFSEPLFDFPETATRRPDHVETFPTISFAYTLGKLQHTGFLDNFFMRCTGYLEASQVWSYTYWVESTGGVRLFFDKDLIFEKKPQSPILALAAKIQMPRGIHRLTLEYIPNYRIHTLLLYWFLPHARPSPVPETHLFHDVEPGSK